jgi:hypothetical protein
MTIKNLEEYFKMLLNVHSSKTGVDFNKLVTVAVTNGLDDFWGAVSWAFKEKHDTLTTTGSSETVNLPDDFEGLLSVVHHQDITGQKLIKMTPDEYDRMIPNSAGQNEGDPCYYKIYYDEDTWKLSMYPTPDSAITLYLTYHTVENGGVIPDKYIGGLIATISKYIYMPGSKEWIGAQQASLMEIERLKSVDSPDIEKMGRFLDASDEPHEWDFEEYMRVRQG